MQCQLGGLIGEKDPLLKWPTHMADMLILPIVWELSWVSCSRVSVPHYVGLSMGLFGFLRSMGSKSKYSKRQEVEAASLLRSLFQPHWPSCCPSSMLNKLHLGPCPSSPLIPLASSFGSFSSLSSWLYCYLLRMAFFHLLI